MRRVLVGGVFGTLMVTLGGLGIATLPVSSWPAQLPLLASLRETAGGKAVALVVVLAGLVMVARAWLRLLPWARDETFGISRSWAAAAVWSLPLLLAPPLFSRDGWSYAAQGYLEGHGLSPYQFSPSWLLGPIVEGVDPRWMHVLTPYGPLPLVWGGFLAHLTGSPWLLVVGDRVFAIGGLVLLAWAVPRLASYAGANSQVATWLVVPAPLMLAQGIGGLHNDIAMAGLMAAALVVAIEHSWQLAAVVAGLAAAVKLPGGLVCVGIVLLTLGARATIGDRLVRAAGVAAVSIGTLVGVGLLTGLGIGWIHALGVPMSVNTPLSVSTDAGLVVGWLAKSLDLVTSSGVIVTVARLVGAVAGLATAGWLMLTRPTGVRPVALQTTAVALLVLTALSPVVHPWYMLWCLPFLAVNRATPRLHNAIVATTLVLAFTAPLSSTIHGLGIGVWVAVALLVVVAASLLGRLRALPEVDETHRVAVIA